MDIIIAYIFLTFMGIIALWVVTYVMIAVKAVVTYVMIAVKAVFAIVFFEALQYSEKFANYITLYIPFLKKIRDNKLKKINDASAKKWQDYYSEIIESTIEEKIGFFEDANSRTIKDFPIGTHIRQGNVYIFRVEDNAPRGNELLSPGGWRLDGIAGETLNSIKCFQPGTVLLAWLHLPRPYFPGPLVVATAEWTVGSSYHTSIIKLPAGTYQVMHKLSVRDLKLDGLWFRATLEELFEFLADLAAVGAPRSESLDD